MQDKQNYVFYNQKNLRDNIQSYLTSVGKFKLTKKGKPDKDSINTLYKYLYIPHYINFHKQVNQSRYIKEGVQINFKTIKEKIFCLDSQQTKEIINFLETNNIIQLVSHHVFWINSPEENKCRCYKIHPDLEEELIELHKCPTDSSFIQKLMKGDCFNKKVIKAEVTVNKSIVNYQKKMFDELVTIDEKAINYLTLKYNCTLDELKEGSVAVKSKDLTFLLILSNNTLVSRPDSLSRIYSPLTNLKKELRPYLRLDGERLIGLDIVNSQLLISVVALKSYIKSNYPNLINAEDFKLYQQLCEKGLIYERLAEQCGLTELLIKDRKAFKQKLYKGFFFSKNSKRLNKIQQGFKELFPTAFKLIKEIKETNRYNEWAILLQQVESQIILDSVVSKLIDKNIPVLTLHDCLYLSTKEDKEIAEQLMIDCFKNYGANITIKAEGEEEVKELSIEDKKHTNVVWFENETGLTLENHWFKSGNIWFNVEDLTRKFERKRKEN